MKTETTHAQVAKNVEKLLEWYKGRRENVKPETWLDDKCENVSEAARALFLKQAEDLYLDAVITEIETEPSKAEVFETPKAESKHTPGPWQAGYFNVTGQNEPAYCVYSHVRPSPPICLISPEGKVTENDKVNAQLITGAPAMANALIKYLENCIEVWNSEPTDPEHPYNIAKAALKEAGINFEPKY